MPPILSESAARPAPNLIWCWARILTNPIKAFNSSSAPSASGNSDDLDIRVWLQPNAVVVPLSPLPVNSAMLPSIHRFLERIDIFNNRVLNLFTVQSKEEVMKDYRDDPRPNRTSHEKVLWGLSQNDISLVIIGILIAVLFFKFPVNWDFVFGLRPR